MTRLRRVDDRASPGPIERGLMAASAVVTVLLFGYVIYQAVTAEDGVHLDVEIEGSQARDGALWVAVRVTNAGAAGVETVTIEVDCTEPAPQATVQNVPAGGRRTVTIVCPPGAEGFTASVVWFEAA